MIIYQFKRLFYLFWIIKIITSCNLVITSRINKLDISHQQSNSLTEIRNIQRISDNHQINCIHNQKIGSTKTSSTALSEKSCDSFLFQGNLKNLIQYKSNWYYPSHSKSIKKHKPNILSYISAIPKVSKLSCYSDDLDYQRNSKTIRDIVHNNIISPIMSNDNTSSTLSYSGNGKLSEDNFGNNQSEFKNRVAVAIDIDGVLVYGSKAINGAKEALGLLNQHKIPFVLLTNAGGKTQLKKSEDLYNILGIHVDPRKIQLCHTPLSHLAEKYQNQLVLLVGGGDLEGVAKEVGFTDFVTAQQYLQLRPDTLPFRKHVASTNTPNPESVTNTHQSIHQETGSPDNDKEGMNKNKVAPNDLQNIKAAFVMHDSTDWQLDIQVLSDAFREYKNSPDFKNNSSFNSHSQTYDHSPLVINKQNHSDTLEHIPFYATNADFIFGSSHSLPRYAQGAFTRAFMHLYEQLTGTPVNVNFFGKPQEIVYDYAYELLCTEQKTIEGKSSNDSDKQRFDYIYAIGDNPASDVRGANMKGNPWVSLLVKTGISRGPGNDKEDPAKIVCNNILDAVKYIILENKITNSN